MSRPARVVRLVRSEPGLTAAPIRRERMILAIDQLAETDRLVLALDLCDGLAVGEIAAALDLTPRLVLRTRERAMTRLRRALAGRLFPRPKPSDDESGLRSAM